MWHFILSKNRPFAIEEVRNMTSTGNINVKEKPRFYKPKNSPLTKANQPINRLNVNFMETLPSTHRNIYFLTIVDEFSRFLFIFPCPDMTSSTVTYFLCLTFSLFETPAHIHSVRGEALLSKKFAEFHMIRCVACTKVTSYNPKGNGQTERHNGIVRKAIMLVLETRGLPATHR